MRYDVKLTTKLIRDENEDYKAKLYDLFSLRVNAICSRSFIDCLARKKVRSSMIRLINTWIHTHIHTYITGYIYNLKTNL
jgi:hypothetical protein